jgi:DNA helicase-2/ATP-dependent DNA helicase PcrA
LEIFAINTLLKDLNPVQREAVLATEGPVLILAGAGSGKTRVLTFRIAYLVQTRKALPHQILAMTFTNKAAGEMKERVYSITGRKDMKWIGTFHSLFAKILRFEAERVGYTPDFVIYDTDDQQRLLKSIMETFHIMPRQFSPQAVLGAISKAKNGLVDPESYVADQRNPFQQVVARLYPEYQNRLRMNMAFDFDDLITVPIRLFLTNADVLEKYRSRFRYILVDEYQDTNRAQYRLIQLLAGTRHDLCVVGDDDQSIYRWRGADITNILDFEKDFPECRVFRLEQNYRSTQTILNVAMSLVQNNQGRKSKELWTEKGEGEKVDVLECGDERDEARRIVEKIQKEVFRNKRAFQDFAVLYRTNAQSRILEEGLRKNGIAYTIVGGVRFYERKEIKDTLAYLKCVLNPNDSVSLLRIINFPLRGIGDTTIQRLQAHALAENHSLFEAMGQAEQIPGISDRIRQSVLAFHAMIKKYIGLKKKISCNELVHTLVDEAGLLSIYKSDPGQDAQNRADNMLEFLAAVDEFTISRENPDLSLFLEEVALVSDVDTWDDKNNAVALMTLHCAKGLEFPVVFITGLEDGLFPHFQSLEEPEALEEERRLFYVGLTRAREKACISWARMRERYQESSYRLPSRFLDELDDSCLTWHKPAFSASHVRKSLYSATDPETAFDSHPDYESFSQDQPRMQTGLRVSHHLYGKGRIVQVEGQGIQQKVIVCFENGVEKKFVTQYAKFTLLE